MAISDELRKLVDPNNECCCEHCLSNKCKEWAFKMGYDINSNVFSNDASYSYIDLEMKNIHPHKNGFSFSAWYKMEFEGDTEPEAIFKACEWIMEQIK